MCLLGDKVLTEMDKMVCCDEEDRQTSEPEVTDVWRRGCDQDDEEGQLAMV